MTWLLGYCELVRYDSQLRIFLPTAIKLTRDLFTS